MIEIIKDEKSWRDQLSLVEHIDFYHTYDYHQLSKEEDETPRKPRRKPRIKAVEAADDDTDEDVD